MQPYTDVIYMQSKPSIKMAINLGIKINLGTFINLGNVNIEEDSFGDYIRLALKTRG